MHKNDAPQHENVSLSQAATYLLEECRMILPGIQALFGFQLVAVFSQTFSEKLNPTEQHLHLLALGLVAVAVALIMTPAAIHRHHGPLHITYRFIESSTRLVLLSMFPLLIGICIDIYLISRIITKSVPYSLTAALSMSALFVVLWFLYPRNHAFRFKEN
jgi:hypothetical protein